MLFAFLACMIAGFINGSYAFPVKHTSHLKHETIWFYFSFIAFLLVPILAMCVIDPKAFLILGHIPNRVLGALMLGGFVFGIGMILFTLCLNKIGMGIAFVLNISLGTIGGSLLPLFLFHPEAFFTRFGQINLFAFALFLISICTSAYGIHLRDAQKEQAGGSKHTAWGLILGTFSGLFCAMQGFVYAYSLASVNSAAPLFNASPYAATTIPWIVIFAAALVPYALFQLYLQIKAHSFVNLFKRGQGKNANWIILMGVLYFASVLIYSKAVAILGSYGQIIAWPIFMIFIILSSNFWSVVQGEWHAASRKSKIIFRFSLIIIILAIILLGYAAAIRN